jgi:hypothetical protein
VGELPQLLERLLGVAPEALHHRLGLDRVGVRELAREPEVHHERDEVLLRAVV